jgi:hypothetical protein
MYGFIFQLLVSPAARKLFLPGSTRTRVPA